MMMMIVVNAQCDGLKSDCAIPHGAHGCECRPYDPNMKGVPWCVGEKLECNTRNRCYYCPEGEFGCDCLEGNDTVAETCSDDQLVCVRGHCAMSEVTQSHGGFNQTCFNGTVPYTKCFSTTLFCDPVLNKCLRCPGDPLRPLGCGCQTSDECASGLRCDSPSGVCAPCTPDCPNNCTRTDPKVTAAVKQASIAYSVTLVVLVVIGLVAGFVVHRRKQMTTV